MRRFWSAVGCLVLSPLWLSLARAETSGTASYQFLTIPVGARATGMGEAFTSVPNDIQGLAYNPASLATLVASQLSFQHLAYVQDTSQEALAFGHAGRQEGFSWGFSSNYLRVGDIPRTIATPNDNGTDNGFTPTGSFSTYDLMLGASAAGPVSEGLVVGSTVKYIRESLSDASASAGAVDIGAIYQLIEERSCNLGASLQNLGYSTKFGDAAVKLPTTMRVGISGQPFAQWLMTTDFIKQIDTAGQLNLGAEMTPMKIVSFRAGYQYALKRPDLGSFSAFTVGIGLRFERMSFDYAFLPLGDLGTSHRISLNFRFKPSFDGSNEATPSVLKTPAESPAPAADAAHAAATPATTAPAAAVPAAAPVQEAPPPSSEFQATPPPSAPAPPPAPEKQPMDLDSLLQPQK